ncbi:MAG: A/G-specific adenine glycosylase [Micromonosporaceae bacterium]|nr:A/G-specific adenine glycosylase [Micromonosporaceae bacterium]
MSTPSLVDRARTGRPVDPPDPADAAWLVERVVGWYDTAARDLPWRRPGTTAWGVLVSEVMLQQTPVARVTPVYEEWLRRWPEPGHLAREPAGEAIRAWGRLGYPRRALRLHECATVIEQRYGGVVPRDVADLLTLPGIGAYTARAVAAFAYGAREPVVDTNVRRLVARAWRGRADGGAATTAADLTRVAALLPTEPTRAARASAALMELGALVCIARQPACPRCPLAQDCAWLRAGRPEAAEPRVGQRYAGTDRQARGVLLALCRDNPDGVAARRLVSAWPDPVQARRALTGLLNDGLVVRVGRGRYGLPGFEGERTTSPPAPAPRAVASRGDTTRGARPLPSVR